MAIRTRRSTSGRCESASSSVTPIRGLSGVRVREGLAFPVTPCDRGGIVRGVIMLRTVGAALVALLAVGVAQATSGVPSPFVRQPAPRAALTQLVQAVGGASAGVDAARFHYLRKLD